MPASRHYLLTVTAALSIFFVTGCGSSDFPQAKNGALRGYLGFEQVKVGMPEEPIKRAVFSFAPDPKGTVGNKNQYLSRNFDDFGGQYIVQCKDGQVFEIQVYHYEKPVSTESGLATLKRLIPADAPQEPVPNSRKPNEVTDQYLFGPNYIGELVRKSPTEKGVCVINLLKLGASQSAQRDPLPKST
jgi:hypothetical protein